MIAVPHSWWWKGDGSWGWQLMVQGKFGSRMQNISSHKMLECKICTSMDNLWTRWGVSCSAGDWGHMDGLVRGGLCTLVLVANRELKAIAPPSASYHCWCASTSPELQAATSILEREPVCCFPGGGTFPIQAQKECFMLTPLGRPGGIWPQDISSPLFYNYSEDLERRGSSQIIN